MRSTLLATVVALTALGACRLEQMEPATADTSRVAAASESTAMSDSRFMGLRTAKYAAADLAAAREWYIRVTGVQPYFDEPFYVGFNIGGFELGIVPLEGAGLKRAEAGVAYWGVNDARAEWQRLIDLGATAHEELQDVGEGILIGSLHDPFGNVLGIIENRHFGK